MSNVPGHIPGYHLPGSTIPIAAVAAESQRILPPMAPSLSREEIASNEMQREKAGRKASVDLRAGLARVAAALAVETARPFVEIVPARELVTVRRFLRVPVQVFGETREECVVRSAGWVLAQQGHNGGRFGDLRLAVNTNGDPELVVLDQGRIRTGPLKLDSVDYWADAAGVITDDNCFATITRALRLGFVAFNPTLPNPMAPFDSIVQRLVNAFEYQTRNARPVEPFASPLPAGVYPEAIAADVANASSFSADRHLTSGQLAKVRTLRGRVQAERKFLPGGEFAPCSATEPERWRVQATAARRVLELKAQISRITGHPE